MAVLQDFFSASVEKIKTTFRDTGDAVRDIRKISVSLRPCRLKVVMLVLITIAMAIPPLVTPIFLKTIIDTAYPKKDVSLLMFICAALAGLNLISSALSVFSGYLLTYIHNKLEFKLSMRLFYGLQKMSLSDMLSKSIGSFIERIVGDSRMVVQCFTSIIPQLGSAVFTLVIALIIMFKLAAWITVLALATIPLSYLFTVIVAKKMRMLGLADRGISEKITNFTAESAKGLLVSKVFGLDKNRRQQFKELLRQRLRIIFASWKTGAFWMNLNQLVISSSGFFIIFGAWYFVFTERLQLGQVVTLGMYISMLTGPFQKIAEIYRALMNGSVSAQRLGDILSYESKQAEKKYRLDGMVEKIECNNLNFSYDKNRHCLNGVNFTAHKGETIAIIGPSGAGKSTLLKILAGLENNYNGSVSVNSLEVKKIKPQSYFEKMAIVPQESFFFADTLVNNLSFSNCEFDIRKIHSYVEILGIGDIIAGPTDVEMIKFGSGGRGFSVGQFQKLATLRAMLKNASLLLLDEITSSIDIESQKKLLQGITEIKSPSCITFLVTHNLSIVNENIIDKVVIMNNGQITKTCTPKELSSGSKYAGLTKF